MRILGIDLETTGLKIGEDKIIEMAYVVKEIGNPHPLLMETHFISEPYYVPHSKEIEVLTGITFEMIKEFGVTLYTACKKLNIALEGVDYILAHNGENFDKPFLFKQMAFQDILEPKRIFETPWLDSSNDVEYPYPTKKLKYLAAEYGIPTPHSHNAIFDVLTMLDIFELQDISKVIERSKSPWITIRALVEFETRDRAKRLRYFWEVSGDKIYPKCWVKRIKECDFERECREADFEVVRIQ